MSQKLPMFATVPWAVQYIPGKFFKGLLTLSSRSAALLSSLLTKLFPQFAKLCKLKTFSLFFSSIVVHMYMELRVKATFISNLTVFF